MYEYMKGKVKQILPTYIVLEVQGIGFRILCPNPYSWQSTLESETICYIEMVVREDAHTLYGFHSLNEKELFLTLNRVSGIGPKSAMSIMAMGDHEGLLSAIETGDSQYLTKFPGVGKKTAQQMILDLGGKLSPIVTDVSNSKGSTQSQLHQEVEEALLGLGYSVREVKKVSEEIKTNDFVNTQEALSYAFKLLLRI